jgi:hypothetical protein
VTSTVTAARAAVSSTSGPGGAAAAGPRSGPAPPTAGRSPWPSRTCAAVVGAPRGGRADGAERRVDDQLDDPHHPAVTAVATRCSCSSSVSRSGPDGTDRSLPRHVRGASRPGRSDWLGREVRMAGTESSALVLNATYEPLCVVSGRRAAVLVLSAKAVPVADGDGVLHSSRTAVPVPAVVGCPATCGCRTGRRCRSPARRCSPATAAAASTAAAAATSLDHVVPKSRGGAHAWENVVSACGRCNHVKADRGIAELGWRLRTSPPRRRAPPGGCSGSRRMDPRWAPYLGSTPSSSRSRPRAACLLAATSSGPDDVAGGRQARCGEAVRSDG